MSRLYDYSKRAFETLSTGLRHLSVVTERETLVVSVARSFAIRVLGKRIDRFARQHPWIDLHVDVHRYFADLESSRADISIRMGAGEWEGCRTEVLTDDAIWMVAPATVAARLSSADWKLAAPTRLRYTERDYWDDWLAAGHPAPPVEKLPSLHFNDSATMLEASEAGAGFCLTRASLVRDALAAGRLVRLGDAEMRDRLCYYAICSARSASKKTVDLFMAWLQAEFTGSDRSGNLDEPGSALPPSNS